MLLQLYDEVRPVHMAEWKAEERAYRERKKREKEAKERRKPKKKKKK